jgi:hypothetical protein
MALLKAQQLKTKFSSSIQALSNKYVEKNGIDIGTLARRTPLGQSNNMCVVKAERYL